MSIRNSILIPIARIRSNPVRRTVLVVYGAPAAVVAQAVLLALAPLGIASILLLELANGIWEALKEAGLCVWATTIAEPNSWWHLGKAIAKVWRVDLETWTAQQPTILRKPDHAAGDVRS